MRLSDSDKKELAIWGGAALLGIVLINYFLIGGEVTDLQRDIDQGEALAAEYTTLYPESQTGRLPPAAAHELAADVLQQQQAALDEVRKAWFIQALKNLFHKNLPLMIFVKALITIAASMSSSRLIVDLAAAVFLRRFACRRCSRLREPVTSMLTRMVVRSGVCRWPS